MYDDKRGKFYKTLNSITWTKGTFAHTALVGTFTTIFNMST